MNSAHDLVGDPPRRPAPGEPLASWYTHGRSDGLGDRLLMFDNTEAPSLELLRFRPAFAAVPMFETALRERVDMLVRFTHPGFAPVRAVTTLDDGALALVSTCTPGKRLSDMFESPTGRAGLLPSSAVWMIRELTAALSALHAQGAGVAHGALAPERIVHTPDGSLVIVEHVLGGALRELRLPAAQLWSHLGVVAQSDAVTSTPPLDARADIVQLGLITLSALLGRRVTPVEYPEQVERLLDEFSSRAGARFPALVPSLRAWLERALQLEARGFASALEAGEGVREIGAQDGSPALLRFPAPPIHPAAPPLPETSMSDIRAKKPDALPVLPSKPAWTVPEAIIVNSDAPAAWIGEEASSEPPAAPAPLTIVPSPVQSLSTVSKAPPPAPPVIRSVTPALLESTAPIALPEDLPPVEPGFFSARNIAAALAVLALVEAVGLGYVLMAPRQAPASAPAAAAPPAPANLQVTIDSPNPGDAVIVDGRQLGVTPFALMVGPSTRSVRVVSSGASAAVPPSAASKSTETRARVEPPASVAAAAAARTTSGGVRFTAPVELQVLEGERVLGSSATGPIVLSAGSHQLDLINSAIGYRSRQNVQIKAGQVTSLAVKPPDGRLSINALPWAQVWIDGNAAGETPLANLPAAVGEHEIIFRHPQLGERREMVVVKSDALTRVSATLGRQ